MAELSEVSEHARRIPNHYLSRFPVTSCISRSQPAGDQPQAIDKLVEGIEDGLFVPDPAWA